MKKLKAALLGAGNRGTIYCDYALRKPEELEIVAVIDTNAFRATEGAARYNIAKEREIFNNHNRIKFSSRTCVKHGNSCRYARFC